MSRTLTILGKDVGSLVTSWGVIEEIKEVLLAKSNLFTGQVSCIASNKNFLFSKDNSSSFLKGINFQNVPVSMTLNGATVFTGVLLDVKEDHANRTAEILMENGLSIPSTFTATRVQNGVDPVVGALALLTDAGLTSSSIDLASFSAAAGPSIAAGATVNFNFLGQGVSTLQALQSISELAGVSFYVNAGLIRAKVFKTYQGSGAELRQPITSSYVKSFKDKDLAYDNFNTQVVVAYGASSSYTQTNQTALNANGGVQKSFPFSTNTASALAVPDLTSATYFAGQYLARTSKIREVISLELGKEFANIQIGDRYPVTDTVWGLSSTAFEVIETHRSMTEDLVECSLASLN